MRGQQPRTQCRAALEGYTSAGKSSILKGMNSANDVFAEDRLFATLDPLTREADFPLHVIDAEHPAWEEQRLVVDDVLTELGVQEKPVIHLFKNMDRLSS